MKDIVRLASLKEEDGAEVHQMLAEQAAQSKEILALVKAILGDDPAPEARGKRRKR